MDNKDDHGRRTAKLARLVVEQRQRVEESEQTGVRVADAKALLKIYEDSLRQSAQDRDRAETLLAAFDSGSE